MAGLLSATGIHEALIAECDSTGQHGESGWGMKEGLDSDRTQRCMYAREETWGFGEFPVMVQAEMQKTCLSHATQSQILTLGEITMVVYMEI